LAAQSAAGSADDDGPQQCGEIDETGAATPETFPLLETEQAHSPNRRRAHRHRTCASETLHATPAPWPDRSHHSGAGFLAMTPLGRLTASCRRRGRGGGVLLLCLVFFWPTRRSTLDARRSPLDTSPTTQVPRHKSPSSKLRTCDHTHAAPLGRPGPRPTVPGPLGGPLGIRLLHVFCMSSARFCTPSERLLEGRPHGCCRRALVPGLMPHGPRA
jgi:hypothetical protein